MLMLGSQVLASPQISTNSVTTPATQGLNIQISPLPLQLEATPGTTVSSDIRVRNTGTTDEILTTSIKGVTAEGQDGHIVFHDLKPTDDLSQWVQLSPSTFTAPAGQWQTVTMTVNVPKTAAFDYDYSVEFAQANPPQPKPGQTAIRGAADVFVLLQVNAPGALRQAVVTSFIANHKTYEYLPVDFQVIVYNSGNIHVSPHGNIFITKGKTQVGVLNVNQGLGNILPKSNRVFTATWSDGFPVYANVLDANGQTIDNGHGQTKKKLNWNSSQLSKFRFGRYTANVVMVYNDGKSDIPISATVSFWVIPWRLLAIVVGAIGTVVALLVYVIVLRRRLKKSGGWKKNRHVKTAQG